MTCNSVYVNIYIYNLESANNFETSKLPPKFMADRQVSPDSMVHHGRKVAEDAASAVPSLPTAPLSPSAAGASCGAIRQGLDFVEWR